MRVNVDFPGACKTSGAGRDLIPDERAAADRDRRGGPAGGRRAATAAALSARPETPAPPPQRPPADALALRRPSALRRLHVAGLEDQPDRALRLGARGGDSRPPRRVRR